MNTIISSHNDTINYSNFFDLLRVSDFSEYNNVITIIGVYFLVILLSYNENKLFFKKNQIKNDVETSVVSNKIEPKPTPEKEFFNKEFQFFEKIFEEKEGFDPNENMDEEFYNMELYKETVAIENSAFEKKWKAKLLNASTPRGNISMYYDVYKMGFAYFSESTFIPYEVLNSLAMKYVRVFRCRDLFMDNKITPLNRESPLIKLRKTEEQKEKEQKQGDIKPINKELLKKGPFAKLKNYKLDENPNKRKLEETKEPEKIRSNPNLLYNVNLFINMGKHANFSFIQRVPKKKVFVGTKSKFSDLFDGEHSVQTESMNYKAFKEAMLKKRKPNLDEKSK